MPISLTNFVQQINPDADLTSMLDALHLNPPSVRDTQKSPHYSEKYTSNMSRENTQNLHVMQVLTEMQMAEITFRARTPMQKPLRFWKELPNSEKKQAINYAISHASQFAYTKTGNCSSRSAFAAMHLYHAIGKQAGISVCLISSATHDQFTVMIGTADKQWFVYDPLTNPELLFEHAEYTSEILKYFSPVQTPKHPLKLKITPATYSAYLAKNPEINDYLQQAFSTLKPKVVLSNLNYQYSLAGKNLVAPAQYAQVTSDAIAALQELELPEHEPKITLV